MKNKLMTLAGLTLAGMLAFSPALALASTTPPTGHTHSETAHDRGTHAHEGGTVAHH